MSRSFHRALPWTILVACLWVTGCASGPVMLAPDKQRLVDHKDIEYPTGLQLKLIATGLTAPSAFTFDNEGSIFVAESGIDGSEPRIYGWKSDGTFIDVYPKRGRPTIQEMLSRFRLHGPIGGMLAHQGRLYVSHRDENGRGVITTLGFDGTHQTVVGDLPAQGDYGVTDLAISEDGRLFFGVGTATNSGVVGPDNVWAKRYPEVCDHLHHTKTITTRGPRFDTPNPNAGIGQPDLLVTSPLQPLGQANQTRIPPVPNGKPNGAIYSVSPNGGDLRVWAYGIHNPRGLRFNEWNALYMTNCGMELRGTRPIANDPDAFLSVPDGAYFGWPDYSADLRKIDSPIFQPDWQLIIRTGYREVSFLVDHQASGLLPPDPNRVMGVFPSQSGAAKFDFFPSSGPFKTFKGEKNSTGAVVVALSGDRTPFATSGVPLRYPHGYKLVRVDLDTKEVTDFVRNTQMGPASMSARSDALERPIDVKFGPDGAMYILDFGRMETRTATPRITHGTGRIYKLIGTPEAAASAR